jgi:protein TonB
MKAVSKLAVILSLGALGAVVASAKTDEQAYLESCLKGPGVPVPVTVVSPLVGPEHVGAVVQLEFTVDATGKPTELSVKSSPDGTLAVTVVDAVKQWRFKPAERDGAPVATKVALPVKIVDEFVMLNSYASK